MAGVSKGGMNLQNPVAGAAEVAAAAAEAQGISNCVTAATDVVAAATSTKTPERMELIGI